MSKRKNNYRVIADFQPAYIRCRASPPRPSLRYDRGYRSLTLTCRAFSPCSRCTKPRLSHQHHNMSGFQPLLPLHQTTLVTPTPQHVGLSALAPATPNHACHTNTTTCRAFSPCPDCTKPHKSHMPHNKAQ